MGVYSKLDTLEIGNLSRAFLMFFLVSEIYPGIHVCPNIPPPQFLVSYGAPRGGRGGRGGTRGTQPNSNICGGQCGGYTNISTIFLDIQFYIIHTGIFLCGTAKSKLFRTPYYS
jgi:hypothetical protein